MKCKHEFKLMNETIVYDKCQKCGKIVKHHHCEIMDEEFLYRLWLAQKRIDDGEDVESARDLFRYVTL